MLASWHILGPKDGKPIITPTQDMILGAYYISQEEKGQLGEGIIFANPDEVRRFYETKKVALHAIIGISTNAYPEKGLPSNAVLITTVGKVLFNEILPKTMPFINDGSSINKISLDRIVTSGNDPRKAIKDVKIAEAFGKKTLQKIVDALYTRYDSDVAITAKTMDAIKDIGFEYSTKSSVTISAFDLPPYDGDKQALFDEADAKVARLKKQFEKGLLTDDERYVRVIKLWTGVKDEVTKGIRNMLADEANQTNPVIIMAKSGARGNESNFTQLLGMRGLMSRSWNYDQKKKTVARDTIETPIKHSFLEGLTILEYFNASYGARKGMADTAMKTSKSGYMTRKLVDAAQEIIVTEDDCGTTKGETVSAIVDTKHNQVIESLADRIKNRFAFEDIINPKKDEIIVRKNEIITPKIAEKIEDLGIKEVVVRSAIHCKCKNGICQKCFGNDLTTNKPVAIGTAIGVIAAQSIGEPGTQLNMRTFHTGGAAGEGNMAAGFERLKQLFELTPPKDYEVAIIATNAGTVTKIENTEDGKIVYVKPDYVGEVKQYLIPLSKAMRVEVKDHLEPGDKITEGSINLKELLKIAGITAVRDYLLKEVQRVYRAQGIEISDKYIEIIIRQMTNKLKIRNPGQSKYFIGQITDINEFEEECNELIEQGKVLPTAVNEIYGLENIAITKTGPFLAAASFQDTKKILTDVAIRGDIDILSGLKENVMIGNKLPAGTGLENSEDVIKLGNEMYKKEY